MSAPRYRFCWWCSKQLHGAGHRVAMVEGHDVRLHVRCANAMAKAGEDISMVRCEGSCECHAPVVKP